jgi:hypothetical protein
MAMCSRDGLGGDIGRMVILTEGMCSLRHPPNRIHSDIPPEDSLTEMEPDHLFASRARPTGCFAARMRQHPGPA